MHKMEVQNMRTTNSAMADSELGALEPENLKSANDTVALLNAIQAIKVLLPS